METRWINHSLPQTLGNAVILLYINAALTLLLGGVFSLIGFVIVAGQAGAGWGIANERKWGYQLGVAMAFLPFALRLLFGGLDAVLGSSIINLLFEILLVALLLHNDSKQHQRIWFH